MSKLLKWGFTKGVGDKILSIEKYEHGNYIVRFDNKEHYCGDDIEMAKECWKQFGVWSDSSPWNDEPK